MGHAAAAQILLAHGADPNATARHAGGDGFTPVYVAALLQHAEVVRVLLDAGADRERQPDGWGCALDMLVEGEDPFLRDPSDPMDPGSGRSGLWGRRKILGVLYRAGFPGKDSNIESSISLLSLPPGPSPPVLRFGWWGCG